MKFGKMILLLIPIAMTMVLLTSTYIYVERQSDLDNKEGSLEISLMKEDVTVSSKNNEYTFVQAAYTTKKGIRAQDKTTIFKVYNELRKIGTYSITIREIDNGDKFVFNRFTNEDFSSAEKIPITITVDDVDKYELFTFDDIKVERTHDTTFGIDPTTNVKGLYRFKNENDEDKFNVYLSQNYISESLEMKYPNGEKSTLRTLVDENKEYSIQQRGDSFQFDLELRTTAYPIIENEEKHQVSESWFLLSQKPLFKSETTIQSYKDETNFYFIKSPKWNTADGNYTKLPWSVEPFDKMAYGRNLVSLQDKIALDGYEDTKDRFFYDMVINSINYLMDFKKDDKKLWETEYTSTWLKKSYGIQAPYTDTRHNENIALFLTRAGELLDIDEIKEAYVMYADFLSTQIEIGNVIETEHGYYVADYFTETQENKTHVSLNHALSEMNFLLKTYITNKNEKHLKTALNIKLAVEDTGTDWINPDNGNFWYQINSDYTFKDKDYPTLTLEDITKSLLLFKEMKIEYSPVWKAMIKSKLDFVISNQTPIPLETVNQLKQLGFEKELNGYEFVIQF